MNGQAGQVRHRIWIAAAALAISVQPAYAWQFREVPADSGGTTLVPTRQPFTPPVAPNAQQAAEATAAPPSVVSAGSTTEPPATLPSSARSTELGDAAALESVDDSEPAGALSAIEFREDESSAAGMISGLAAGVFRGIEPGKTSLAEVKKQWGEPLQADADGDAFIWYYQLPGFEQVDLMGRNNKVNSIVAHLETPISLDDAVDQLQLAGLRPVDVVDPVGVVLGRAYPERGLAFGMTDAKSDFQVAHVILERISPEAFRLRAEQHVGDRYEDDLADLEIALRLDPRDAGSHWLRAELLAIAGRLDEASRHARKALESDPTDPVYRLTLARIVAQQGARSQAMSELEKLASSSSTPTVLRAWAEYHIGETISRGPQADPHRAIEHHVQAIQLATPLIDESHVATRRLAKRLLVNAHLSVALDVATGHFQRQEEVVPKWLAQATELAEEYIEFDKGDPTLRLDIYRTTLAAMAEFGSTMDPSIAVEEARRESARLLAETDDAIYEQRIETLLAETLYHAARLERLRNRPDTCQELAEEAVALLEPYADGDHLPEQKYVLGQMMFLVGSLHAVQQGDHATATEWFDQARPLLQHKEYVLPSVEVVHYGELLVSMGVSYWETGENEQAISLTQQGINVLEEGVKLGAVTIESLMIPYGNLAAMYEHQGHHDKAERAAQRIAELRRSGGQSR